MMMKICKICGGNNIVGEWVLKYYVDLNKAVPDHESKNILDGETDGMNGNMFIYDSSKPYVKCLTCKNKAVLEEDLIKHVSPKSFKEGTIDEVPEVPKEEPPFVDEDVIKYMKFLS
jgi:hypothetical protein